MSATRNARQWEPVVAPVQSSALGPRTPEALRAVVAQFDVEGNPRYRPANGRTYCNIFASDVTSALGCEVPHWVEDAAAPKGRRELNVNGTVAWLEAEGPAQGWHEAGEREAAAHAATGGPALAIWRNPTGGPGHVAILLPPREETRIAQAGKRNFGEGILRAGFGNVTPIRFFIHA